MASSTTRISLVGMALVAGLAVAGCGASVAPRHPGTAGKGSTQTTTTSTPSAYQPPLLVTPSTLSQVVIAEFRSDLHPAHLTIGLPPGTPQPQFQAFKTDPNNNTWDALQIPLDNIGEWISPPPAISATAQATELRQWAQSDISALGNLRGTIRTASHVYLWVHFNKPKDTIEAILAWQ